MQLGAEPAVSRRCSIVNSEFHRRHAVTDMAQERGFRPTIELLLAPELVAAAQANPVRFEPLASVFRLPPALPTPLVQDRPPPPPLAATCRDANSLACSSAPCAGADTLAAARAAAADCGSPAHQCPAAGAQVSSAHRR